MKISQQGVTINITVKNTFLDIKGYAEVPPWRQNSNDDDLVPRRSSSVPRTFKPGDTAKSCSTAKNCSTWPHSDDSTNASDKDCMEMLRSDASESEQDMYECCSTCTEDIDEFTYPFAQPLTERAVTELLPVECAQSKVTLSLDDMVSEASRRRLRAQAQPFMSARAPPAEVTMMIASAAEALSRINGIVDVQVRDGGMGGTTMIVAQHAGGLTDASWIHKKIKADLLNSSERSSNTYVLGYGGQPFKNLDPLSFSANIACVPAAHQSTACWDFYKKGFCQRCATCRWSHPSEADMMRIIVMINRSA